MSTGPANTGPLIPGPLSAGGRGASRFGVQAFLIIAFLFLCGLAGAGIKLWQTGPVAEEVKPPAKKFTVVLAAADLDVGREIRSSDMYTLSVGADEYRTLIAGKTCFSVAKELVGRIIRNKVDSGSPFTLDCVYPDGTGPTPADLLSDGMRAVTVRMGLVGGLRGLVSPESWVDVMFRRNSATGAPESTSAARTHTLFAGVRVLGIQDSLYPETVLRKDSRGIVADKFEVTLELTPAQCEVLKSVEDRGELSLNMLPREAGRYNDGSVPEPEIMKVLLGVQPPEIPLIPAPVPSVKVTRGGNTSNVPVEQVVDTIIDSHLYPAPADGTSAVPGPPGAKPAPADDQWPPKSTVLPPNSALETVPQSPPPESQNPGSPSPGASRPTGTSGSSTLVRRPMEPDSATAAAR
ncbi:MAG: Flp pilus assembly protein CpaB, partial [Planctomyces sp.]